MANREQLEILCRGAAEWNEWRRTHSRAPRRILPDLSGARLSGQNLRGYDLAGANLWGAKLQKAQLGGSILNYAQLRQADLSEADLTDADAKFAVFSRANLSGTILTNADLRGASFRRATLRGADLRCAILRYASIAETEIAGARLDGAEVYGAAAWGLKGEPESQCGLIIQANETAPPITIDDLETAQFLFLLMDNTKIADVIETASRRTVLILGRFTPARMKVLNAIKRRLFERNFVPVLFDFAKPQARDLTETVASLAYMACFIVADLTKAKSIPQELSHIVPYLPSVPVIPLILESEPPYAMFEHFQRYRWVQPAVKYRDLPQLMEIFDKRVLKVGFTEAMKSRGVESPKLPKPPKWRREALMTARRASTISGSTRPSSS